MESKKKFSDLQNVEEVKEYFRSNSRRWYSDENNAEKKRKYMRDYYRRKRLEKLQEEVYK